MTTWQIVIELFHGAKFYWRKFFVFLTLMVVVGGGIFYLYGQRPLAEIELAVGPQYGAIERVNMFVEIKENGQVLIDGKNNTRALKILPDSYEINILALREPGIFIYNFYSTIVLPKDVGPEEIKQRIYAVHGVETNRASILNSRTLAFEATNIEPRGELTLVINLPKNVLNPPWQKKMIYAISQISAKSFVIIAIALPLVTMLVMLSMIIRRQRDKIFYSSRKVLAGLPEKIPPAIVGGLIDGQLGSREIAATLIDLANRGYIYIVKKKDDFSFGKRKSLNLENLPELNNFERSLLSKIFEMGEYRSTKSDVDMRVARHIFSRKVAQVYQEIYDETVRRGYFIKNPATIHLQWRYGGIGLFFLGFIGFIVNIVVFPDPKYPLIFYVGAMIMAVVIIRLSSLMPVRSVTGTVVLRQWLQFREYLLINKPIEPSQELMDRFASFLPYAIIFGVEADWARRFLKTSFIKPDWYDSEEQVVTLERFIDGLFEIINYVGGTLDKSHDPTVQ